MNGVRERLSSRALTCVAVVIAVLWTTPTLGLLLSSLRPEEEIRTTGWWTLFGRPHLTLDNYRAVLSGGGNGSGRLAEYFVNSVVITVPPCCSRSSWPSSRRTPWPGSTSAGATRSSSASSRSRSCRCRWRSSRS
ncbi:hypothetical protein O1L60_34435 [Streptomyces diastatochromogenes]|nr:hypothetical protein [Streptomyces diastatochromogenes]